MNNARRPDEDEDEGPVHPLVKIGQALGLAKTARQKREELEKRRAEAEKRRLAAEQAIVDKRIFDEGTRIFVRTTPLLATIFFASLVIQNGAVLGASAMLTMLFMVLSSSAGKKRALEEMSLEKEVAVAQTSARDTENAVKRATEAKDAAYAHSLTIKQASVAVEDAKGTASQAAYDARRAWDLVCENATGASEAAQAAVQALAAKRRKGRSDKVTAAAALAKAKADAARSFADEAERQREIAQKAALEASAALAKEKEDVELIVNKLNKAIATVHGHNGSERERPIVGHMVSRQLEPLYIRLDEPLFEALFPRERVQFLVQDLRRDLERCKIEVSQMRAIIKAARLP